MTEFEPSVTVLRAPLGVSCGPESEASVRPDVEAMRAETQRLQAENAKVLRAQEMKVLRLIADSYFFQSRVGRDRRRFAEDVGDAWRKLFPDLDHAMRAAEPARELIREMAAALLSAGPDLRHALPDGLLSRLDAWATETRGDLLALDAGAGSPPLLIRMAADPLDPARPVLETVEGEYARLVRLLGRPAESVAAAAAGLAVEEFEDYLLKIAQRRVLEAAPSADTLPSPASTVRSDAVGSAPRWLRAVSLTQLATSRAARHMAGPPPGSPMPRAALLVGPTGSGKERLSREAMLELRASRPGAPFVAVNCATFDPALASADLFGIDASTATGVQERKGLFVEANRGVLFLDEVHRLPPDAQGRLLRVLETGVVEVVGRSPEARPKVCVFVLAATNMDALEKSECANGPYELADDLHHRLAGTLIRVPSLVERGAGDLELLRRSFEQRAGLAGGTAFTANELRVLASYEWPGNVRELRAAVELRAMIMPCGLCGVVGHRHGQSLDLPDEQRDAAIVRVHEATAGRLKRERIGEHFGGLDKDTIIAAKKRAGLRDRGGRPSRTATQAVPPLACSECDRAMRADVSALETGPAQDTNQS